MADKTQTEVNNLKYSILDFNRKTDISNEISNALYGVLSKNSNEISIEGMESLTSISIPSGSLLNNSDPFKGIGYFRNATGIYFAKSGVGGEINLFGCKVIKYLYGPENPNLTRVIGLGLLSQTLEEISLNNSGLEDLMVDGLVNLTSIKTYYSSSLITIGEFPFCENLTYVNLNSCAIESVTLIDSYIAQCLAIAQWQLSNGGLQLTLVSLSGGTNAIPSATGISNASTLSGLGVTVTYNS